MVVQSEITTHEEEHFIVTQVVKTQYVLYYFHDHRCFTSGKHGKPVYPGFFIYNTTVNAIREGTFAESQK